MDEKTEELRDIFIDATGSDTVTEAQEESPGSLADESDASDRVRELIRDLRDTHEFETDLDLDAYETVARHYFEEADDAEIAAAAGIDPETAFAARLDLHLVRESDRDAPFALDRLRSLLVDDVPLADCAERLGVDEATVAEYAAVVETDLASTRANDRFRDGFAELLSDADLEERLASDAREDGLEEATEDMETNVSF
ncbi:MAG: conditioned medium-induced protein 4 [Halobaculum sp.]